MASLSLKNVNKVYPNGFQAVKDFNMEIADKEFIIFVGPSGCGKSTTLRMIAGLEDISSGEFYIDGKLMNDVEPKDRDIAMVFQNYALYPHMSVYDNMAFGLKLRKVPKDEIDKAVKEAARILDLTHLLDRKPKALSGGQRQRVAMGRAIVRDPKVFLLDEPLSNLDAKLRANMRTEISKLYQRLGTTFIYVTHDQTEAMTMGTRIVVMKDGLIQQVDTPQNLYDLPCNLFVAGFIGTPQMNFINGKLEKKGEDVERENITIKHLLTHTSGIPAGIHVPSFMRRYEKYGNPATMNLRDSLVTYLANDAARLSRPGEVMRYSCLNFITLQAIIENVTGCRLDEYARREVFEPMQLKNTWYNYIDSEPPYSVDTPIVPTTVQEDGTLLCGEVHDPTARIVNRGVSGNAGVFSTAEDLAAVASMLMNGGKYSTPREGLLGKLGFKQSKQLYSQHCVDTFFELTDECQEHGRTLGWNTGSFGDLDDYQRVINHTGYTGTSIQMNLDKGVAVILLTNRVHPIDDGAVGRTRALVTNIISSALR